MDGIFTEGKFTRRSSLPEADLHHPGGQSPTRTGKQHKRSAKKKTIRERRARGP
jgi:hypothetical protein